jgi:integrase
MRRPVKKERTRARVLSDDELCLVWNGCDKAGWPFGPMVQLLILTGQRRQEVAGALWQEFDLDNKRLWSLPRERVKNGRAHDVPLSDAAIEILEGLPRIKNKAGLVFTTRGDTPVSGFSRAKARLDAKILDLLREEAEEAGRDPEKIEAFDPWTLHDLRRTAASGWARLGVPLEVTEKILNHVSGAFSGVAGVYQRHDYAARCERQAGA